jgi:hypothetical protein
LFIRVSKDGLGEGGEGASGVLVSVECQVADWELELVEGVAAS